VLLLPQHEHTMKTEAQPAMRPTTSVSKGGCVYHIFRQVREAPDASVSFDLKSTRLLPSTDAKLMRRGEAFESKQDTQIRVLPLLKQE